MKKTIAVVVGVMLVVMLVVFTSTYTVRYNQVAIKTRFGKISDSSVQTEPGLHFRLPLFAEKVITFDTRMQLLESPLKTVATADDQQVMVRAFLMWKVDLDNVKEFYRSFKSVREANDLIKGNLSTSLEQKIKGYKFGDLIGVDSRLPDAEVAILDDLKRSVAPLGIDSVSLGISQVVLPAKTAGAVLKRMQASISTLANIESNKGSSEAAGIRSEANTLVSKLLAFGNQRAEEISAAANEKAAGYLKEMNQDVELATFLLWIETLEQGLRNYVTIFSTDEFAPWHLLNLKRMGEAEIIPKPSKSYIIEPVTKHDPVISEDDEEMAVAKGAGN